MIYIRFARSCRQYVSFARYAFEVQTDAIQFCSMIMGYSSIYCRMLFFRVLLVCSSVSHPAGGGDIADW
jgi:hypothetical protein